jgi:hypothetical protein
MNSNKKNIWFTLFGAILWIVVGLLLASRPPGHPPSSFRQSADLMPLLALGLVTIGVSSGFHLLSSQRNRRRLFTIVCYVVIYSSLAYALGVLIRQFFLQATGWEPFMPLGFLVFILSWIILGVLSLKKQILSRFESLLMITSGISLFTFNDQYNPYGAVVFGVLTFLMLLLSAHFQKQTHLSKIS